MMPSDYEIALKQPEYGSFDTLETLVWSFDYSRYVIRSFQEFILGYMAEHNVGLLEYSGERDDRVVLFTNGAIMVLRNMDRNHTFWPIWKRTSAPIKRLRTMKLSDLERIIIELQANGNGETVRQTFLPATLWESIMFSVWTFIEFILSNVTIDKKGA